MAPEKLGHQLQKLQIYLPRQGEQSHKLQKKKNTWQRQTASAKRNRGDKLKLTGRDRRTLNKTAAKHPKTTASKITTEFNQHLCYPVSTTTVLLSTKTS